MPTGIVAVILIQPLAAGAVPGTEDADAAAALVAAGASPVMAMVTKAAVCRVNPVMSCFLAWQGQARIQLADERARASFAYA